MQTQTLELGFNGWTVQSFQNGFKKTFHVVR